MAKKQSIALYFVDSAHFVHLPYIGYVWSFVRVFLKASSGRKRFNILGAFDVIKQKLITITNESYINSESVKELLYKLRSIHSVDYPIHLVLDNARYQRCNYIIAIAESLKIHLEFIPPYSPNLNLIERLWKFMKKKVLYGKYYDTFNCFKDSLVICLDKINNSEEYQKELSSLISCNFQFF